MSEDSWINLEAVTRNVVAFLRSSKEVSGLSCIGAPLRPTRAALEVPGGASSEAQAELNPDGAEANVAEGSISPEGRDEDGTPSETEFDNLDRCIMSWACARQNASA